MTASPLNQLQGEVVATQIVLQRVLANIANNTGDFEGTIRKAHEQCLADLEKMEFQTDGKVGLEGDAIRAQAQAAIDRMHTYLRKK